MGGGGRGVENGIGVGAHVSREKSKHWCLGLYENYNEELLYSPCPPPPTPMRKEKSNFLNYQIKSESQVLAPLPTSHTLGQIPNLEFIAYKHLIWSSYCRHIAAGFIRLES